MNFSQFSKNKLDKEQMLAVRGGSEYCWQVGFSQSGNPVKICEDGCTVKLGESIPSTGDTWGWKQLATINICDT